MSAAGLAGLRGRGEREEKDNRKEGEGCFGGDDEGAERDEAGLEEPSASSTPIPPGRCFAAVDAANAKAERTLADETRARPERDPINANPAVMESNAGHLLLPARGVPVSLLKY